jgi:cytidylate kinase
MTIVTLSRQLGSHGEEIATQVAQALGLRLIDAEAINQAAHKAGVPEMALAELEQEGERSLANQMLKALRAMPGLPSAATPPGPLVGAERPPASASSVTIPFSGLFSPTVRPLSTSMESYVRMIGMVIRGLAHQGNVLILGRGGQALLRRNPEALHLQVVAPVPYRVDVVMARFGFERRAAQSRVRASDRARADYLRRYHGVDWLDPTLYHLVINTAALPIGAAVDLIIAAAAADRRPPG